MKVEQFTVEGTGIGNTDYAAPKPVGQVPVGPVYTSTDVAELAARLGSIVTFDRRGNVVFLEDFESGVEGWLHGTIGTGASVVWSAETSRSGGFSCKITTCLDGLYQASITKTLPLPVLGKIGAEISFSFVAWAPIDYIYLWMYLNTRTQIFTVAVRYDRANDEIQYRDSAANWVTVTAEQIALFEEETCFHSLKMVADFVTGEYTRVIINNAEYDLSGIAMQVTPVAVTPQLVIFIVAEGRPTFNDIAYIDSCIVTQNEPINV